MRDEAREAFEMAREGLPMPLYTAAHNPFIRTSIDCESFARDWFSRGHASAEAKYGALIHWPDCWDTAAYPTLESALREIGCNPEDCTKLEEAAPLLRGK